MLSLIETTHSEWHSILNKAFAEMDRDYLQSLKTRTDYLPRYPNLLSAFNFPLDNMRYVLLGESPYPRLQSANGYAFWDNAVESLWGNKGLSKEVNRATSLRNMMKMLLLARGDLQAASLTQEAIIRLDKSGYWETATELFQSFVDKGFLLLNASLVYAPNQVRFHAKHWQPFIASLFEQFIALKLPVKLVLFGRIAAEVPGVETLPHFKAEHPYNLTFITNPDVLDFFKPLDLLSRYE